LLDIDSKSETKDPRNNMVFILAQKMDEEVKSTIKYHEELFGEKS
jgi:hypothetical protein